MSSKVRQYIVDSIAPKLPVGWKIEPGVPTIDTLTKPLLWIEYTGLEPLTESPLSSIKVTADLCIATSKTDLRKAEDEADDLVAELYAAAFAGRSFYNITASKTIFADAYVGWRLSLAVIITEESP